MKPEIEIALSRWIDEAAGRVETCSPNDLTLIMRGLIIIALAMRKDEER